MVLQEKMKAVEVGLDTGHLRIPHFLLPTFPRGLGFNWDLCGCEEADSTCGAIGVEHVIRAKPITLE